MDGVGSLIFGWTKKLGVHSIVHISVEPAVPSPKEYVKVIFENLNG